jgi:VWFA-related protein
MKRRNLHHGAALVILALLFLSIPAMPAQETAASSDSAQDQEEQPLFQVNIDVVTIPVTVTDSSGEFITDLNIRDFRVIDNGKEQKIEGFELSWEPVSMVIAVETSKRVEGALPEIERSGILFTQLILGESGEAAVLSFDREINLLQDFTDRADLVEGALKNLQAGGEDVRLSDALARALFLLQRRPKERRKVIVVISEARDNGSSNNPGFVLRGAQQLGVSVYTIGLNSVRTMFNSPPDGPTSPFPPGVAARPTAGNRPPTPDTQVNRNTVNLDLLPLIRELVSYGKNWLGTSPLTMLSTGTGAVEFSGGGEATEEALARIGRELRSQYLLTYRPNNLEKDEFHTIQVLVQGRRVDVRTRPGYLYTRSGGPR